MNEKRETARPWVDSHGRIHRGVLVKIGLVLLALCFVLIAMPLLAVVGYAYLTMHTQSRVVNVFAEAPTRVRVGKPFPLAVTVSNTSPNRTIVWTGVSLGDGEPPSGNFLSVSSSEPSWQSIDYDSGYYLYRYKDMRIAPMAERQIVFILRADRAGSFSVPADVYARDSLTGVSFPIARTQLHATASVSPE